MTSCVEEGSKSKLNDGSFFCSHLMHKVTIFTCLVEGKESIKIQISPFFPKKISIPVANLLQKKEKPCSKESSCFYSWGLEVRCGKIPVGEDG